MKARINFFTASPDTMKAMLGTSEVIENTGLDHRLLELIKIRASQINGCAFCVHMHARDARAAGVPNEVLDTVSGWREAPWFSERERAALAWTERLTRLGEGHHDDEAEYDYLATHFSEKERTDLTYAIGVINMWNRFNVGFRHQPE
ncbi:carboxymuconolactone decarboxylase family protein [Alcanivorax sp. 24]|uniref:carboxymuconolactone decarboxylase family protein n=1 Tax=Alcanivorax sp. 24 TaxID=2545266 RepID=UPI001061D080|nr:carboxymuconolactone decarboxylase family protein [Alcanivorax sp. 24]